MSLTINTNVMSLNAQRNLSSSSTSLATSMQRLSSGLRINSAKDDAAGDTHSGLVVSAGEGKLTMTDKDGKNEHTEGEASPNGTRKILSDLGRCAQGDDSRSIDEASDHPENEPDEDNAERACKTEAWGLMGG